MSDPIQAQNEYMQKYPHDHFWTASGDGNGWQCVYCNLYQEAVTAQELPRDNRSAVTKTEVSDVHK